jgi:toxin ParE1/3/4
MEIRFTPLASSDLEAIGDYIGQDKPARAYSFVLEIRNQCRKIASAPMTYKCRPEFGESIRSCAFGKYVIFYKAEDDGVLIIRILHGAMDIAAHIGGEH